MNDLLMKVTANMPCKVIAINNLPYLERYHITTDPDGTQHWLHRFLRSDSERHVHSHPWTAVSNVLCGWYVEEFRFMGESEKLSEKIISAGEFNQITPTYLHRIIDVLPNTWTYMKVSPERIDDWFFIDDEGNKKFMKSSSADWYTNYPTRESSQGKTNNEN